MVLNVEEINKFMDFLNHKIYWFHAFKPTISGEHQKGDLKSLFSSNRETILKEAERLNGQGILCLAINEREENKTKNEDVKNLDTLIFDIDVRKNLKQGYVSTKEHHEHALKKAEQLKIELELMGFCVGLVVDSGNGAQVYGKLKQDLTENKQETIEKITKLEELIRSKIADKIVDVDCITKDINRRMKIPGTINKKDTAQVEDRVARIVYCSPLDIKEQEAHNNKVFEGVLLREKIPTSEKIPQGEQPDKDQSRSAKEFGEVIKLIQEGRTKEEVFQEMDLYSKWASSPTQYKELTYKKALEKAGQVDDKKPQIKTTLEVLTYTDLKKFKVNKNFIVENFLYPGGVTMMYAPPAEFKSLISAGMGFAVTNGIDFLGMKTKKTPVLYLDGENSQSIMKERAEQIHKGFRLKRNKFPLFFLQGGLLMDSKKKINLSYLVGVEALIKKEKIKVIIFDTLHRYCLYDENSSDDLNKLYTQVFKPLADQLGVAVVFLHHSTKSGGYRGSGDFLGMVDVSYRVERNGKTNQFKIVNEKCRSGEIPEIKGEIVFGDDYIRFNRLNEAEEQGEKINKLVEVTQKIEELFDVDSKLGRKDIISFLEMQKYNYGCTKNVDRALKFLVEKKKVLDKDTRGVYRLL